MKTRVSSLRPVGAVVVILILATAAQTAVGVTVPSPDAQMMPSGGVIQATTRPTGSGLGTGKAQCSDLSFMNVLGRTGQTDPTAISPAVSTFDGLMYFDIPGVGMQYGNVFAEMTLTRDVPGGETFSMLISRFDISGGTLDAGVLFRESPTLISAGHTQIQPNPTGGYLISSFFDVFFELSIDGGQNWEPASGPVTMELVAVPEPAALSSAFVLAMLKRPRRQIHLTVKELP